MPQIDLQQGTDKWIEYRKSRIMATDIPIILGSNSWSSELQLWEEKLNIQIPQSLNDAMKRGQLLEPEARKLAIHLIGIHFEPCVYQSNKYPWLAASLDGISTQCQNAYILEIKCPKEFTHLDSHEGNIPFYYLDQIQHQLLVTDAKICYYFSYRPEYVDQPYIIQEIHPDLQKQKEIIEKSYNFYYNLCNWNPPEEWKFQKKVKKENL